MTFSETERVLVGDCGECGGDMIAASVDENSVLDFPMRFVWTCNRCEHTEVKDVR